MRIRFLWRKPQLLWRRIRWGFPEQDLWCLYSTQAKWILPRLKKFRQICQGFPAMLAEPNEDWEVGNNRWGTILDKMILAFEYIVKDDCELFNPWRIRPEVEEGLKLFHDYYFSLWD